MPSLLVKTVLSTMMISITLSLGRDEHCIITTPMCNTAVLPMEIAAEVCRFMSEVEKSQLHVTTNLAQNMEELLKAHDETAKFEFHKLNAKAEFIGENVCNYSNYLEDRIVKSGNQTVEEHIENCTTTRVKELSEQMIKHLNSHLDKLNKRIQMFIETFDKRVMNGLTVFHDSLKSQTQKIENQLRTLFLKLPDCLEMENTSTKEVSVCPSTFEYIRASNSCYRFLTERHNWDNAVKRCNNLYNGSYLATILTKAENDAVIKYINETLSGSQNALPGIWIGGQREAPGKCSSPFVWKTSPKGAQRMDFTYWSPEQPDCYGGESCVHMRVHQNYTWNDLACHKEYTSVCKLDLQWSPIAKS